MNYPPNTLHPGETPMTSHRIGLAGVAAVLPPRFLDLDALAARRLVTSAPDALAGFGFRGAHVADADHDVGWMARDAARRALADAGLSGPDVDVLIWASALPANHVRPPDPDRAGPPDPSAAAMDQFRYAVGWLQDELGADRAEAMAVGQQGCATMFTAIRTARALIAADPHVNHVLCVGADALPPGASREIMYNVISDAAAAVVVSRDCPRDVIVADHRTSNGYYWDPVARRAEIMAAYFPTSRAVVAELLAKADLPPAAVDRLLPTGVNHASWDVLARLIGIDAGRIYRGPVAPFGHTLLVDNFIYLQALRRDPAVAPGARLLLFTYGFGSTWAAMLLEH
ncbi:MAG TPA: 3-oxoacyl-[acyl-carrier-protein] synthase III C-terminal domain-containing protein [Tepidisphaeraceae bacterium]|nr:3-oxoacyl-[acyl-carrier-protein] synthase III C-terminal domain-containing protein [Tepidisphaeraceae bacterium]